MTKPRGRCLKCDRDLSSASFTRHLGSCVGPGAGLHVVVDGGGGAWWMHLALTPTATLRDLDGFLRKTWLECCGHLSAYEIDGTWFQDQEAGSYSHNERSMATKVATLLAPGNSFKYSYDFGSTTRLRGRVVGTIVPGTTRVALLARNADIAWPCSDCGAPAVALCPYCDRMVCGTCKTPCGCGGSVRDYLLVVNSPRMGVCGYVG